MKKVLTSILLCMVVLMLIGVIGFAENAPDSSIDANPERTETNLEGLNDNPADLSVRSSADVSDPDPASQPDAGSADVSDPDPADNPDAGSADASDPDPASKPDAGSADVSDPDPADNPDAGSVDESDPADNQKMNQQNEAVIPADSTSISDDEQQEGPDGTAGTGSEDTAFGQSKVVSGHIVTGNIGGKPPGGESGSAPGQETSDKGCSETEPVPVIVVMDASGAEPEQNNVPMKEICPDVLSDVGTTPPYEVEFTYNGETYSMEGNSEILLSDVLTMLNISENGDISSVVSSNPSLFSAEQDGDGQWLIKANQIFKTSELLSVVINGQEILITVTDDAAFAGGDGSVENPYQISTVDEFKNMSLVSDESRTYFILLNDLSINRNDCSSFKTKGFSGDDDTYYAVVTYIKNKEFDGNRKTITYTTAESSTPESTIFGDVFNSTINNLTVYFDQCTNACLAFYIENCEMNSVVTDGALTWTTGNYGAFANYSRHNQTLKQCSNKAKLQGIGDVSGYDSVFFGYLVGTGTISFDNCSNQKEGSLIAGKAGMFASNWSYSAHISFEIINCKNFGTIQATFQHKEFNYFTSSYWDKPACLNFKVDGTSYTTDTTPKWYDPEAGLNILGEGGKFTNGPFDQTLDLKQNRDNTFLIIPCTDDTVVYYVVSVGTYTGTATGSSRTYATEKIQASDSLRTTLENLHFVDYQWVTEHPDAESGTLAGNTIYTLNDVSYYLVQDSDMLLNGQDKAPEMISVSAYDQNDCLRASVELGELSPIYCVSYEPNGGSGTMEETDIEAGCEYVLLDCSFSPPDVHKQFSQWEVNGTARQSAGDTIIINSDTVIKALWEDLPKYQISFDPNSGTGTMDPVTQESGSEFIVPGCGFSAPEHKEFQIWDLDGVQISVGTALIITENITLKALWKDLPQYQVSFDPNSGTGTMNPDTVWADEIYVIPVCGYTAPEHKLFKAWSLNGTEKKVGDQITLSSDITLMALWEDLPQYQVSFDPNSGTGTMNPDMVWADEIYVIPVCGYTAPEHKLFKAWSLNGTEKKVGDQITLSSDITLMALWEDLPKCTVFFDPNSGTGTMKPVSVVTGETYTVPVCSFTAPAGAFFRIWDLEGKETAVGEKLVIKKDIILKALWTYPDPLPPEPTPTPAPPKEQTIDIDSGDGTSIPIDVTVKDGKVSIDEIPAKQMKEIIESNKATGEIEIDLTNTGTTVNRVELGTNTVKLLADSEVKTLTIDMNTASITLNKKALAGVSDTAKGETVTLVVEDIDNSLLNAAQKSSLQNDNSRNSSLLVIVDSYIVSGNTRITDLGNGKATLALDTQTLTAVKLDGVDVSKLVLYEIYKDGKLIKVDFKWVDGKMVFDVNKLSQYVIFLEN